MLKEMIYKELRSHLMDFRFFLTLTLTLIMFIVSAFIFSNQYHERIREFREIENKNNEELNSRANNLSTLAIYEQTIQLKPTPMELIAEGNIKNLPNSFIISAFDISEPQNISRENNFMKKFTSVDWTFTIAFILSFFAILMSYDAISGEKTIGTLGLMLSNSVSRNVVILGKYLSALIILILPLITSIILSLLIVNLHGQIVFSIEEIGKIILYSIASIFYLSVFILFGLLISSITKNSITSIIILLFIWVCLGVLIPNSGGKIAAKYFPIPTREQVDQHIANAQREIQEAHLARNPEALSWSGDPWDKNVPARAELVNAMYDIRIRMNNEFMYQRMNQIKKARSILMISPTAVFTCLTEQICITGLNHFEYFYKQVFNYRKQFRQFIEEKDRLDPDSPHQVYKWEQSPMSQKPVNPNSIPRFQEKNPPFTKILKKALFNFSILIIFNAILFIAVFTAFQRYDVR
ncbi:MAG: ABC transporter permease [Promethearchaeota archaeon]